MPRELAFRDVLAARDLLAAHLPPTPMWTYPALDAVAGATVQVTVRGKTRTVVSRSGATVVVKAALRHGAKVTVRVGRVTKRLNVR